MRRVIVIQARMTSTRLPGKVLMDLGGRTVIEQQLARLQRCERVDEIVWAVTTNADAKLTLGGKPATIAAGDR